LFDARTGIQFWMDELACCYRIHKLAGVSLMALEANKNGVQEA
jgi:hypothetical protein